MEAKVYNMQGKEAGKVTLPDALFSVPWNADLVHQVVTSIQANARTPIAHAKTRGEVRGGGQPVEQVGEPTYARKISPAEARIDWSRPAVEVDAHIRGLSPFPGGWFEVEGPDGPVRIKALMSGLAEGSGAPGTVLDDALTIACGSGAVRLERVQRPGKAAQSAEEMLRGFAIPVGTRLPSISHAPSSSEPPRGER